mgnify:FL=1
MSDTKIGLKSGNPKEDKCFQDLFAIKFHFKMNYDIHRQATNNSLGSHEYRQL